MNAVPSPGPRALTADELALAIATAGNRLAEIEARRRARLASGSVSLAGLAEREYARVAAGLRALEAEAALRLSADGSSRP